MNVLMLDNYDSFTYNLVHILRELGVQPVVHRNDKITMEDVAQYDKIMLSPGPGVPDEAGLMKELIRNYGPTKSILGICLGHQAIAEVHGARLFNMTEVLHGVTSKIVIENHSERIFSGLPGTFEVTHYHSWSVSPDSIPDDLEVTATNEQGLVMALSHRKYDVCGLQFHPESVMTQHGKEIIKNWLKN